MWKKMPFSFIYSFHYGSKMTIEEPLDDEMFINKLSRKRCSLQTFYRRKHRRSISARFASERTGGNRLFILALFSPSRNVRSSRILRLNHLGNFKQHVVISSKSEKAAVESKSRFLTAKAVRNDKDEGVVRGPWFWVVQSP